MVYLPILQAYPHPFPLVVSTTEQCASGLKQKRRSIFESHWCDVDGHPGIIYKRFPR